MKFNSLLAILLFGSFPLSAAPTDRHEGKGGDLKKPNIILVYADDISARELPLSNSSVVFSPSRAMMTGRFVHLHKWWNNKDVANVDLPADFEINGKSLVPFLFTGEKIHRDDVYGYRNDKTIFRGKLVVKDGRNKWWDVSQNPGDLISFPEITDWFKVPEAHRAERKALTNATRPFDLHATAHDAPGYEPVEGQGRDFEKAGEPLGGAEVPAFTDTFDSDASLKNYSKIGLAPEAWTVVNGILVGTQVKPDHGCVIRKDIAFDDITMEIQFRFNGGSRYNFVFDDAAEKSVWASHICRVSISPKSLKISDDKTGSMNLEIRKRRQTGVLTPADEKILADTQSNAKIDLKKGRWYQLRVIIKNDIIKAFIDGKLVTKLKSPGIDHATKSKLGMTVNGTTIDFDNFKIFKN